MSLEVELVTYLGQDVVVAALIADRAYPLVLPQEPVLPAISYQRISDPPIRSQTGISARNPRVRFNCWDRTYDGAVALEEALIAALDSRAFGPAEVKSIYDGGLDDRDPDTGLFRRIVEFLMWRRAD